MNKALEVGNPRLARVDFLGAMEVDQGVQIYKNNKNDRGRETNGSQKSGRGKMKVLTEYIGLKIFTATPRRRALRSG